VQSTVILFVTHPAVKLELTPPFESYTLTRGRFARSAPLEVMFSPDFAIGNDTLQTGRGHPMKKAANDE
jgi:hypothetical protein